MKIIQIIFSNTWIISLIIFIFLIIIVKLKILKIRNIFIYYVSFILWFFIILSICFGLTTISSNFKIENAISLFIGLIAFLSSIILSLITNHKNKENILMQLNYNEKIKLINRLTECMDTFNVVYNNINLDKFNLPRTRAFNKFLFIFKYFKEDMGTFNISFPKTSQKIFELRKKFYTPYDYEKDDFSHKVWKEIISGIFITEIKRENYKNKKICVWKNKKEKIEIPLKYDKIAEYVVRIEGESNEELGRNIVNFQEFIDLLLDLEKNLEEEIKDITIFIS